MVDIIETKISSSYPGVEIDLKVCSEDGTSMAMVFSWRPTINGVKQKYIYLKVYFSYEFCVDFTPSYLASILGYLRSQLNLDISNNSEIKMLTKSFFLN